MFITGEDQGGREYMEDRISFEEELYGGYDYYAIFDGHGGPEVASFLKTHMKYAIKNALQKYIDNLPPNTKQTGHLLAPVILAAFKNIIRDIPILISKDTGSTAVVMLKNTTDIWIANCGDSRAIMDNGQNNVIQLTNDHKPDTPDEYQRILSKGGNVSKNHLYDVWRVNGVLAVSRAIGDFSLFPHVTWKPEIHHYKLNVHKNKFIFMATDGVWDVLSNENIVEMVDIHMRNNLLSKLSTTITKVARQRGSTDNIAFILVLT